MRPFRVPEWDHFGSLNGTISGSQMSPFRDSPNDPKMTTLSNGQKTSPTWGIARENAGLAARGSTAESPSHSLSHPSDGFATTPARTAAVRASVMKSGPNHSGCPAAPTETAAQKMSRCGLCVVKYLVPEKS